MRTGNSLVFLTWISVILCSSLAGCVDDPGVKTQATNVQATLEKPVTLTFEEIDLLAECQGHEEFAVEIDPDDELVRMFLDAYRQAATYIAIEQRQQYEQRMKGVQANLAAAWRDFPQSSNAAERQRYRSEIFGAEAEKLWNRCDVLIVTRFPKIDDEMIAKARALGINL